MNGGNQGLDARRPPISKDLLMARVRQGELSLRHFIGLSLELLHLSPSSFSEGKYIASAAKQWPNDMGCKI